MKRLLILFTWFPFTLSTLLTGLFFYSYRFKESLKNQLKKTAREPEFYQMYVSHPKTLGVSTTSFKLKDGTFELIHQYLTKYKSPMTNSAYEFVKIFKDYGIDPIVPLAIAQCESNLGKKMPPDCNNPFGLGIHSQGTLCFETWEEGYEKMARDLKKNYVEKGLITVEQVMEKYCPISAKEKEGSWARCVNKFIGEIETLTIRNIL